MNNFLKLGTVNLSGLQLSKIPDSLWTRDTWRQNYPGTAHSDTKSIYLRMCRVLTQHNLFNDLMAYPYTDVVHELMECCPQILNTLYDVSDILINRHGGTRIGRAMLVSLRPGGRITPHVDEGTYAGHYRRTHLPLQTAPGNVFRCNGEEMFLSEGEVWQFNHRVIHSAENRSDKDRIHLIVDYI